MPRNPKRLPRHGYYEEVLDERRRRGLRDARTVEGLDQDIALLRTIIRAEFNEPMVDRDHVLRIVNSLCRAELTRDRLAARSAGDLRDSVAGVLKDVGDLLDGDAAAGA